MVPMPQHPFDNDDATNAAAAQERLVEDSRDKLDEIGANFDKLTTAFKIATQRVSRMEAAYTVCEEGTTTNKSQRLAASRLRYDCAGLHESLTRTLFQLDDVPSHGDSDVRVERKRLATEANQLADDAEDLVKRAASVVCLVDSMAATDSSSSSDDGSAAPAADDITHNGPDDVKDVGNDAADDDDDGDLSGEKWDSDEHEHYDGDDGEDVGHIDESDAGEVEDGPESSDEDDSGDDDDDVSVGGDGTHESGPETSNDAADDKDYGEDEEDGDSSDDDDVEMETVAETQAEARIAQMECPSRVVRYTSGLCPRWEGRAQLPRGTRIDDVEFECETLAARGFFDEPQQVLRVRSLARRRDDGQKVEATADLVFPAAANLQGARAQMVGKGGLMVIDVPPRRSSLVSRPRHAAMDAPMLFMDPTPPLMAHPFFGRSSIFV